MIVIAPILKGEYTQVVDLWETSVRTTHDFLNEEDILFFKPLILNQYLDAVNLFSARDCDNNILGFMGLSEDNIEMLFIHPSFRGKGIGKLLINHALGLGMKKVSVNEQNEQAVGFYKRMGFVVVNRSELDDQGKPYPILYMELNTNNK